MEPGFAPGRRRLRSELEARRRALRPEEFARAAEAVEAALCGHPAWRQARRVTLYAALASELPTWRLAARLRAEGRTPLWPRLDAERGLVFAAAAPAELVLGRGGFRAPPAARPALRLEPDDLVVVPCVGFDARGVRLGRGGGHYDRAFPPGAPAPRLVGLAFACQQQAALPEAPHDRRLDLVVTERGLFVPRSGPAASGR